MANKNKASKVAKVHPRLRTGICLFLNDCDTDFRLSLLEGTSLKKMTKLARVYITSRDGRLEDFCVYLYERRASPCCCLEAVTKAISTSYMTRSEFQKYRKNLHLLPTFFIFKIDAQLGFHRRDRDILSQ